MSRARWIAFSVLLCFTLAAQSDRETAEKLMTSGRALAQQKSPDDLRQAGRDFEQAAVLWRTLGAQAKQVEALEAAAWTHFSLHELNQMSALLDSAMEVAGKLNVPAVRAELLTAFAVLHNQRGEFSKAIEEYAQAVEIFKTLNNTTAESQVTSFLASSWRMQGIAAEKGTDVSSAIESHRRAAAIYEQTKDFKRAGQEYARIGQLFERSGTAADWEQSEASFMRAIPLLKAASDRPGLANAFWGLGSVAGSLGQTARARDALAEVLPLLDELKNPKAEGIVLNLLASAEEKLGDLSAAADHYERALKRFTAAPDAQSMFIAGMKLGKVQEALGQNNEALATYQTVIANAHAAGNDLDEATAQVAAGLNQFASRRWNPALAAFHEAQKLHARRGDKPDEATDLLMIGSIYGRQGQHREKVAADLRALELVAGGANRHVQAQALTEVGDAYNSLHRSQQAIEYLERARTMAAEDTEQLALVLVELGEVCYDQTKLEQALVFENQALDLARKLNKPAFVSRIRNSLALTLQARGEMKEAGEIFEKDLAEARGSDNVQAVYSALHNLGKLRQDFGDNQEAAKWFEQALALEQKDGDRKLAAITLDALGTTYHSLGEDEKALAKLNYSLSEWRALGDENGQAISLNNLALIYNDMGRPQQAIEAMNEAISRRRSLGDDAGVAILHRALGGIYQTLGDYDRAQSYFAQALATQKQFGDEYAQAVTHNSLGVIQIHQHEPRAALREFDQALSLLRKFGDHNAEATTLSNMANVSLDLGDFGEAEARLNRSLAIARETHSANLEALSLHGLGSVYEKSGQPDRARDNLRQAVSLWHKLHEVSPEAKAFSLLAQVELKQHNTEAAITDCDEAIRLLESQRGGLGSEDLRAYYLASIAGPYKLKVELLMAMHRAHPGRGWDARAFEASERSRARSLLDLLAESRRDPEKGADPRLAVADRAARQSISTKAVQLHKLAPGSDDFEALQLEVAELTAERERIAVAIRKASPPREALSAPRPITLSEVRKQVLDAQTILLEYSLGEYRSYLFVVTPTRLSTYELPRRAELVQAAADVFSDLQDYQVDRTELRKNSGALSTMLLGPVAGRIAGKRLVIAADGELAQIPFAFLPDPSTGDPLIVANEVVNLPSASTAAALRVETAHRRKPAKEIAVIADPVFEPGDARMRSVSPGLRPIQRLAETEVLDAAVRSATRGGKGLARLKHSSEEAAAILALAPASRSLALTGFQASRANVLGPGLADYRIVHFATHGLVDSAHPQLSGLALSQYNDQGGPVDGFLEMNAIFDMKLQADLVVLSACESGQGKLVGGEGMMSLTRSFLYAGAASLIVSAWRVDDEATSELMKRLYQGMLGSERLRPAAALRSAQRSMLLHSRWTDPYYWAAFSLQGEWR